MASTGPFGKILGTIFGLFNRNPKSNRAVVEFVAPRPDDRVLDIGCGTGSALELAATMVTTGSVSGVDPTESLALQAGKRVPTATVEMAGVEALPFDDDSFSVAWSISAFHHWPDPDAGIAEALRVLEPGGILHIAEKVTTRPGLHGLDSSEVEAVRTAIVAAGFESPSTTHLDVGRKQMVVLSAKSP